ncbi:MAG: iron-sulfur cluster repair di-iron protein [Microscillaceae bacterium]|nr:iron-sulfur cluster repair di-iron protein [Microscillaceae bacterium]
MPISPEILIGSLVAEDYRAAAIFQQKGIDFCCGGQRTLAQVCEKQGLDVSQLIAELEQALASPESKPSDFRQWPLDQLTRHIEQTHHRYVEETIPVLKQFLAKLVQVHGKTHPELVEIQTLFFGAADELTTHMKKEEFILFPFIRKMAAAQENQERLAPPVFGSVHHPIGMMEAEHAHEGERFRQIAHLSQQYTAPEDACATYRATYATLQEFEANLHQHIHLENNILFPQAIALETALLAG